ncbi:MAG: anti-sigma factor antagonist [Bacteroidetes bacterium]|nr:MAG: anti-sigma factor antagonist [Bacteroidota bacterium]
MNFEISHSNQYSTVTSNVDKLDATKASELKSEFVLLNKKGINSIVLNLGKTKYCDSSGLSAILVANRLCKDSSGKFVLCGLNATIMKLVSIAQLDRIFTIVDTLEEAQAFMKEK